MVTKKTRSDKTGEVYEYIQSFIEKNGYSPSVRDILAAMGFNSTATVQYYINKLEKQGLITKTGNKNRTLSLQGKNNQGSVYKKFPLLGRVSAGLPILAVENIEEYYSLPQSLFKGDDLFLLRVDGDSMIGAGIFNGDLIIVNKEYQPENNDIVVAYIDGDVTVKRLFININKNSIVLHAENVKYKDLVVDAEYASILGKVIGSIRKF
ncbi:MAG: transcriptional repressor LexA [Clostridia bacterium]